MLNWLSEFAVNLSGWMLFPLIGLTVLCVGIILHAFKERSRHLYASQEYGDATYRIHASVQGMAICWLAFILVSAVPAPDYQTKVVEKIVEKKVNAIAEFDDAYDMCIDNQVLDGYKSDLPRSTIGKCEKQAYLVINPDVKIINFTETRVLKDPYKELYNNCIGSTGTGRNASELCHKTAIAARNEVIKTAMAQK